MRNFFSILPVGLVAFCLAAPESPRTLVRTHHFLKNGDLLLASLAGQDGEGVRVRVPWVVCGSWPNCGPLGGAVIIPHDLRAQSTPEDPELRQPVGAAVYMRDGSRLSGEIIAQEFNALFPGGYLLINTPAGAYRLDYRHVARFTLQPGPVHAVVALRRNGDENVVTGSIARQGPDGIQFQSEKGGVERVIGWQEILEVRTARVQKK